MTPFEKLVWLQETGRPFSLVREPMAGVELTTPYVTKVVRDRCLAFDRVMTLEWYPFPAGLRASHHDLTAAIEQLFERVQDRVILPALSRMVQGGGEEHLEKLTAMCETAAFVFLRSESPSSVEAQWHSGGVDFFKVCGLNLASAIAALYELAEPHFASAVELRARRHAYAKVLAEARRARQ